MFVWRAPIACLLKQARRWAVWMLHQPDTWSSSPWQKSRDDAPGL
jgi:hypothetical protein